MHLVHETLRVNVKPVHPFGGRRTFPADFISSPTFPSLALRLLVKLNCLKFGFLIRSFLTDLYWVVCVGYNSTLQPAAPQKTGIQV